MIGGDHYQEYLTFISELIPTDMTLEWTFPCVSAIVVFKLASRLKALLADVTHKSKSFVLILFEG